MTTMTFEMFQATRRWSDNLVRDAASQDWEPAPATPRGWVYLDGLFIDEVLAYWPDEAKAAGKWHLLIERDEYITDDLEPLERKLFDWAFGDSPAYFRGENCDDPFAFLTEEYAEWNKRQGLNLGSADEHYFDENLTEAQRAWLIDFGHRWEQMAHLEAEQDAIERRIAEESRS
jgi:hypothetical protein